MLQTSTNGARHSIQMQMPTDGIPVAAVLGSITKKTQIFETLHHLLPDRSTCMCEAYGFSRALGRDSLLIFKYFGVFFTAEEQKSRLFAPFFQTRDPTWVGGGYSGGRYPSTLPRCWRDRVTPVSTSQTHRSRRAVCLLFILSDTPLIFPLYSFSHLYTLNHSWSHLFFTHYFTPPRFFHACCISLLLTRHYRAWDSGAMLPGGGGLLGLPAAFLQLRRRSLRPRVLAVCCSVADNALPRHASSIMFKLTRMRPFVDMFSSAAVLRFHAPSEGERHFALCVECLAFLPHLQSFVV